MRRGEGAVAVQLALVGTSWGGAYVAGRFVMGATAPATAVAVRFVIATVCSVLGFVWWNEGVDVLGPSRTAIFNNLVPVSGLVLGSLLLGEAVTGVHLAGAALVVAGVVLMVCGKK